MSSSSVQERDTPFLTTESSKVNHVPWIFTAEV